MEDDDEKLFRDTLKAITDGRIRYAGGDGFSAKEAIVIAGARNILERVLAEHIWLGLKIGEEGVDWEGIQHAQAVDDESYYSNMKIKILKTGEIKTVWFDIGKSHLLEPF